MTTLRKPQIIYNLKMLEVGFSGLPKLLSEEHVLKMAENLCYFQFPAIRLRDTC